MSWTGLTAVCSGFISLLLSGSSWSDDCQPSSIHMGSQAELDAFQARHGPCDLVRGDLIIIGANIESLRGLSGIRRIDGDLLIENTEDLIDLAGLGALETVSGDMTVFHNFALQHLGGLERLEAVGGQLAIFANPVQRDVDALVSLVAVGGLLGISDLPALEQIEGLVSLEWVGSHLIVVFNNRLERLDGLDSLVHVGGYLRVKLNLGLYSCIALSRLLDIHDDGPPGPQSGAVPDVGGIVEFEDNLPGCNALEEVTAAATVVIGSIASGAWHNPEIPGQGMFISTWPASREIFLMWSTFDTAHADRGQRWLTAHGNWVGNRGQLSLYSTGGGVFNSSLLVPNSEVVGSMWLEFSSPDVAAAAYELPDLGLRGVIPLRRIR